MVPLKLVNVNDEVPEIRSLGDQAMELIFHGL